MTLDSIRLLDFSSPLVRRIALAVTLAVPLLTAVIAWRLSPPILNPDSAEGFLVWESSQRGAPWNTRFVPDDADIAHDREFFLSWWSPGQYAVPGELKSLVGTWGNAMVLTTVLCVLTEAAGCWVLARLAGFSPATVVWFVAAATLQWHTLQQFGHFRGGEVLLEAAAPWLLAAGWWLRDKPWLTVAATPVLLLGGLWLKLSAPLIVGPVLAVLGWHHWRTSRARGNTGFLFGFGLVAAGALALWTAQAGFFDRGLTPAYGPTPSVGQQFALATFSLASPWLAATGLGSVAGRVSWRLAINGEDLWRQHACLLLAFAVIAWTAGWRYWIKPLDVARRHAIAWTLGTGVLLLGTLYLRGSTINLEDRHLRPVATLLLLAAAAIAADPAQRACRATRALLLLFMAYGCGAAAARELSLARLDQRGTAGFCQQQITRPALAELTRLDASFPDESALIYVPSAEIALEVQHQRRLPTDDLTRDLAAVRRHAWHGRVAHLIVTVPDAMEADGRGAAARAAFAGYAPGEWRSTSAGGWRFWIADGATPPPS